MQLEGKIVVVTGAGSGIGKALVKKFISEGAKAVVAVDINAETSLQTASELGCIAMSADVAKEDDIIRIIEDTEKEIGPIDLFCNNAGIAIGESEQSSNKEWQAIWEINVMSHVYAARHLVPRMIKRGGGYFLNTASAAGLLNQIGGAAYGTSKHAAVGFGEWLAMTYAHQGIKVSLLCPQAVRTAMTANAEDQGTKAAAGDGMMEPDQLADIVVEHLERDAFLILTHPEVKTYMERKSSDYDRWISGMNRLQQTLAES
jgi:NAD(P)-dependent dehydrogenase (short-subunit alcohol dehydrogenase family)|tara:strand:- start:16073 stop:16849 length:777 start_codon:yes stop_codon:yes gene_type:complete